MLGYTCYSIHAGVEDGLWELVLLRPCDSGDQTQISSLTASLIQWPPWWPMAIWNSSSREPDAPAHRWCINVHVGKTSMHIKWKLINLVLFLKCNWEKQVPWNNNLLPWNVRSQGKPSGSYQDGDVKGAEKSDRVNLRLRVYNLAVWYA